MRTFRIKDFPPSNSPEAATDPHSGVRIPEFGEQYEPGSDLRLVTMKVDHFGELRGNAVITAFYTS